MVPGTGNLAGLSQLADCCYNGSHISYTSVGAMAESDVLILAVARQPGGLLIAGMTTEPDPKTGLRWVRPVPETGGFELDELRFADGSLVRPGDVVRLALADPQPTPPYVENVRVETTGGPLVRIRRLTAERREAFFKGHVDTAPRDVLADRSRSLALVRPYQLTAIVEADEETGQFATKFAVAIASGQFNEEGTPKFLRSRDDIVATDIYWRALMRSWLPDDEDFLEYDIAELRERIGEVYLVIGLSPKGTPRIIGVNTVPEYEVQLDEDIL